MCSVCICVTIIGIFDELHKWDPSEGIAFLILGLISGIPGFFVICTLRKAWKAEPGSRERSNILAILPL